MIFNPGFMEDNYLAITPESCTCPGDVLVFECTVDGDGGTFWQGAALQECLQNRILIRHSQFRGNGHTDVNSCGASGTIVVRTISAVNNSFTTQLTIIVNQQLNGGTIECTSDSGRYIGSSQILLKTGIQGATTMPYNYFLQHAAPRASSINFTLGNVKQGKLTFTWKGASESCPAVNYKILSNNCGDCPHTVNSSFVTCSTLSTGLAFICTFTVQAVVCDNILGQASDPIAVLVNSNNIYLVLKLIIIV